MTIFNSRDENYKSPFGAVCCGAAVNFTVTPGPEFCACALLTFGEFADAHGETALLPCPGGFSGVFTAPEKPELVWYSFRFTRPDGSCVYLGRNGLGEQTSRQPWQLTVYESRPTPEWFGRGVTYQIFPDRFCRDAIPDPKGLLGQRTVHDNWDDPPRLGPDPLTGRWNSDFFGGSLRGICRKLDYLQSLSVTTLYLNPIFYAASSHRYDTADYRMIDPMLGTEGDLRMLCAEAKKRGIHVMLDGVFNHTGDDSRYFNRGGFFDTPGAYQSKDSPWYDWFCFQHWPDKYDAWWGIDTLPAVNENAPAYRDFIIRAQDSVIRRWLRCGADGWRLDVADELPDDTLAKIRAAVKEEDPDAVVLGEVWEDAITKFSYGSRRKYALGSALDTVMNYPFRSAVLDFFCFRSDAWALKGFLLTQRLNYPLPMYYALMNLLSSHDVERARTALATRLDARSLSREQQASFFVSDSQDARGAAMQRLAALVQFAVPGVPCVYYGDETGMNGMLDPFNRAPFSTGARPLVEWYQALGRARRENDALSCGVVAVYSPNDDVLAVLRCITGGRDCFGGEAENGVFLAVVNRAASPREVVVDLWTDNAGLTGAELAALMELGLTSGKCLLTGEPCEVDEGLVRLSLPPESAYLFRLE